MPERRLIHREDSSVEELVPPIIRRREIDSAMVMAADQVLVGLNKTRRLYNTRLRELNGFRDPMPGPPERGADQRDGRTGRLQGICRRGQALEVGDADGLHAAESNAYACSLRADGARSR